LFCLRRKGLRHRGVGGFGHEARRQLRTRCEQRSPRHCLSLWGSAARAVVHWVFLHLP
jgi:hypothetical protein